MADSLLGGGQGVGGAHLIHVFPLLNFGLSSHICVIPCLNSPLDWKLHEEKSCGFVHSYISYLCHRNIS